MSTTREIIKRRIGSDGEDIDCDIGGAPYFDLKEHKKARYEQGRGFRYRRTIYTHAEHSEKRVYEEPPLRIKNPDDEEQYIDYKYGNIKYYWLEAGRGAHYQKTRVFFNNTADNNGRKTREQRVENEDTGDYIDVERITHFVLDHSRGFKYQAKKVHPCNTEEQIEESDGPCKEVLEEEEQE